MRTRQTVATGLAAVTLGMGAIAAVLVLATLSVQLPNSRAVRGAPIPFAVTCGAIDADGTHHQPENTIGRLFNVIGSLCAIDSLIDAYTVISVLVPPADLPGRTSLAWTLTWLWVPPIGLAFIFLPLLFQTGHPPSQRWRPVAWLGALGTTAFSIANASATGRSSRRTTPTTRTTHSVSTRPPTAPSSDSAYCPSASRSASRPPRSTDAGVEAIFIRHPVKWVALSAVLIAAVMVMYGAIAGPGGYSEVADGILSIALGVFPVTIAIAILRYHLFEIDRIVSRTLSYLLVTSVLLAAYAVAILVLQGPLSTVTGGETIAVALSTLVAAAAFQPLRRRVQGTVDRRFDRARFDAEQGLRRLRRTGPG